MINLAEALAIAPIPCVPFTALWAETTLPARQTVPDVDRIIRDLAWRERWLRDLAEDLLPILAQRESLGQTVGEHPDLPGWRRLAG